MHYFSNKFSKITRKPPASLIFQFWWAEVT